MNIKDIKMKKANLKLSLAAKKAGYRGKSVMGWEFEPYNKWTLCYGHGLSEPVTWRGKHLCAQPYLQEIVDWLREKKKIYLYLKPHGYFEGKWYYFICSLKDPDVSISGCSYYRYDIALIKGIESIFSRL